MPGSLDLVPTRLVYPYHHRDLMPDGSPPPIPADAIAHHVWASRRKSVSVVIPWRAGCAHRGAARAWLGERLAARHPDWQIVDSDCEDTLWNKAEAIISGARRSFGDIIVMMDADVWSDGIIDSVDAVRKGAPWSMPHGRVHRLTEEATAALLDGADDASVLERCVEKPYRGVDGGGIVVLSRDTLERVPPDTRFRGWGGEDEAWAAALSTLAGPGRRFDYPLLHLWHPPQERKTRSQGSDENTALWREYRAARGNRQRMLEVMGRGPGPRRIILTYRNTQTGRQRIVRAGTQDHQRLEASAFYEVVASSE